MSRSPLDLARPPLPAQWPADRLFRLLTQGPRPIIPIASVTFAPHLSLCVRAVSSPEVMRLIDAHGDAKLAEQLVIATLLADGEPAFQSPEELGAMSSAAYAELEHAVLLALHAVSPTYVQSDVTAWTIRLTEGANSPTNFNTTRMLAQAFDWTGGFELPHRYFGVPLRDICDGPLMAYRAAVDIVARLRKH